MGARERVANTSSMQMTLDPEQVVAATRRWLEGWVIAQGLCPFAAQPLEAGLVRFAVSDAEDAEQLFDHLIEELRQLSHCPASEIETTLLIHPNALLVFDDYNAFLDAADGAIDACGLVGTIQVASFHPQYRFHGVPEQDVTNATNRSPHPMLHLLREASIERATREHPDPLGIPVRNQAALVELGAEAVERILRSLTSG